MWMEIEDSITKYIINANAYDCIRKGNDCSNESTIIFYNSSGEDLILLWKNYEERNEVYQKILNFVTLIRIRY